MKALLDFVKYQLLNWKAAASGAESWLYFIASKSLFISCSNSSVQTAGYIFSFKKSLYQLGMLWFQYCVIDPNIGENRILAAVFLLLAMSQKKAIVFGALTILQVFSLLFLV